MQYDVFREVLGQFPIGRYVVNSCQLTDLVCHQGFKRIGVRVLHLGTVMLDQNDLLERLRMDKHPRLDGIKITCLDGEIIIDEPSHGSKLY